MLEIAFLMAYITKFRRGACPRNLHIVSSSFDPEAFTCFRLENILFQTLGSMDPIQKGKALGTRLEEWVGEGNEHRNGEEALSYK